MEKISITDYDEMVLRTLNGEDTEFKWGAAATIALEYLKGIGYVKGLYEITEIGKAYLNYIDGETS